MNDNPVELSVVIPVYNAENHIEQTVRILADYFSALKIRQEIILADDLSTDNTFSILNKLAEIFPAVKVIRNTGNIGQDRTMLAGIKMVSYAMAFVIDDDFEYEPDSLSKLLERALKSDTELVYGIPSRARSGLFRRMTSAGSHRLSTLLGYPFASNYRLLSGKLIAEMKSIPDNKFFNLDKALLTSSTAIQYVTVENKPSGRSRFTFIKLLRKFLNFIFYQKK